MANTKLSDKEIAADKSERIMNGVATWASFYRANPQRFCKDYLNINLKLFQQIIIYMMNICTNFCFAGSRGVSKSFLIAVFACCRAILYPKSEIVISCKVRAQAIEILDDKILKELCGMSPNLKSEILRNTINNQKAEIIFKNGSYIKVVTAADSARGNRANLLILDEYRMLDKPTIDLVLKKFLVGSRHPKYLDNPKYANLGERNKQVYLSSAWFKAHWSYELCKDYFSMMLDTTRKYFCCCLPYQIAIREHLESLEAIEDEMLEGSFDELSFRQEKCVEWIGVTEGGLFNFDDVNKTRNIKQAFYAPNTILNSSKIKIPEKEDGEKRIGTVDIALMSSKKRDNDATSILLNCLKPDKNNRCTSNFTYTENIEGATTPELALKIRRYVDYFDLDYIGVDCRGIGLPITDLLMHDMYDPELGITYPAISCCNNEEIAERCPDKNAPRKLWAIMGSAQFNNDAVVALRSGFQQGRIRMLMSELECEDVLRAEFKGYDKMSPMEKAALKLPYINTGLAVNELVNLGYEATNNVIRVQEKSGCRKDRYSAMSYNYYIAQQIERGLEKNKSKSKEYKFYLSAPQFRKGAIG